MCPRVGGAMETLCPGRRQSLWRLSFLLPNRMGKEMHSPGRGNLNWKPPHEKKGDPHQCCLHSCVWLTAVPWASCHEQGGVVFRFFRKLNWNVFRTFWALGCLSSNTVHTMALHEVTHHGFPRPLSDLGGNINSPNGIPHRLSPPPEALSIL